jgi:glyoxylase-like metal-dependent hydrolase (beta-lactamase superfamily II)
MHNPTVRAFFDENTATWSYVVWSATDAQKRCTIIDSVLNFDLPSCSSSTRSADVIIDFIKEKQLVVEWILETHIHADHLTAAHYLKEKLGGKIAISKHILTIIATWVSIFQTQDDTKQDGSQFDHLFDNDQKFTVGDMPATILHTPGHTPADTTYVIGNAVFVGDTIFLPDVGSGRCDFPGGSAEHSYDSSRRLFALPDDHRIYVGHDYPPEFRRSPQCMTTISEQKQSNVLLHMGISKEEFVQQRQRDDKGKAVPPLLLPSIQANLRNGQFGKEIEGTQFIKLPVNKF